MGILSDPLNTFWQVFVRSGVGAQWTLVTPPGVADNGGLVVSAAPATASSGDASLLAGFEPSQALAFSPLAASPDQGSTWSAGLVNGGLASVPDALSASASQGLLALLRGDGGEVVRSDGDPSTWSELVDRTTIASSSGGRSCRAGPLTAVALDAERGPLVATTCTAPGEVGILAMVDREWRLVVPRLSGRFASASTRVLRLVDVSGRASGLVATAVGSTTYLIGISSAGGGSWLRSPPLPVAVKDRTVVTSVEPGGGFVVLASRSNGSPALEMETGPAGAWQSLPPPPLGTATVVVGAGGVVDALVAGATVCTDWRFDTSTASWSKISTVSVPIQFGSSS
jgi:hypothetical protein